MLKDAVQPYFIELNHADALNANLLTAPTFPGTYQVISGRFEDSVIYENHATFGKHLITNDFAFDSESLFVVDRIGVSDLPKTASNGKLDNLIKYSVSIRAEDGGELDYSYNSDRDVPLASIRSHWVTMVGFSNSDGGIRLFCLN